MTADVLDLSARDAPEAFAGGPAFPAQIPEWVPPVITNFVRKTLVSQVTDPDQGQILIRLVTDPRMRNVWSQLVRTNRKTGGFYRPALSPGPEQVAEAAERQDWAMTLLFSVAYSLAVCHPCVMLRRKVESLRAQQQELARKLRQEAEGQYVIEQWENDRPSRGEKLDAAADAFDEIAAEAGSRGIVAERDRGLGEAHALAVAIAQTCGWLFGSPLYTVTATITSVAIDREVSRSQVRGWRSSSCISGGWG
jgi:hypothetical protein